MNKPPYFPAAPKTYDAEQINQFQRVLTLYLNQVKADTEAAQSGDSTKTFSVAPATAAEHAVRSDQISTDNTNFPIYTAPTAFVSTLTAGSGSFTTETHGMSYIKIGKLVTVFFWVSITINGTAAGYMSLTLPFSSDYHSSCSVSENGVTNSQGHAYISSGDNHLYIFRYDSSYLGGNGYFIRGQITYRTAS